MNFDHTLDTITPTTATSISILSLTISGSLTLSGTASISGSYGAGGITTNFAAGDSALSVNTTGFQNTSVGQNTLLYNLTGSQNIAIGATALYSNSIGSANIAIGIASLYSNLADFNVAIGGFALQKNTTGTANLAIGANAMQVSTTTVSTLAVLLGGVGTFTGGSGYANGSYTNIPLTYSSGSTAATYPSVDITVAGGSVTICTLNIASDGTKGGGGFKDITTIMTCASIGAGTGFTISPLTLDAPTNNTAIGGYSLFNSVSGNGNTAIGSLSLSSSKTGFQNTAIGYQSLGSTNIGYMNTAVGYNALSSHTNGFKNTAIGYSSGLSITTGSNNVIVGGYQGLTTPISQTGSGWVVLSDGAGIVRQTQNPSGALAFDTAGTSFGTAGQVLQSNGNAAAPAWTTLTLMNMPGAWVKTAADCATTVALTLNTAQTTIDGIAITATTRVLVKDQASPVQNGIYTGMSTTTWVRDTDAATSSNIAGATISIDSGTTNVGQIWTTSFRPGNIIETDAMNWYRILDTSQSVGGSSAPPIGTMMALSNNWNTF